MVKNKTYDNYKDSGVDWLGEVPEHWKVKKLKYLVKEHSGNGFPSKEQGDLEGSVPFYKVSDINGETIYINEANNYVTPKTIKEYAWNIVPRNSLIAAKIGEALRKNHRKITRSDCIIDNNCIAIEAVAIDCQFNFYLHKIIDFEWFANPGAVPSLSVEKYKSSYILSPSLTEQRTIADFLDRRTGHIDELIAKKERVIELLREKRTALISHAVTKGLNPDAKMKDSGVEWLGEVPEHWEVHKLKHIATVRPSNVDKKTVEGEHPVKLCNYTDVYYNERITCEIDFMNATASQHEILRFTLEQGDVLITKDSEAWDDIAVSAYVADTLKNILCGYHLAHIRPDAISLDGNYLCRALSSFAIRDQFRVAANGITRFGLSANSICSSVFPVPPLPEQQAIADFLDSETSKIDALTAKVTEAIEKLKEYRTALISAAVTGKIDVREGVV